jgi:hypothetical protein
MTTDNLVLTLRVFDPKEKQDATKSACWATVKIDRAAISLPEDVFVQQFILPMLKEIKNLKLVPKNG